MLERVGQRTSAGFFSFLSNPNASLLSKIAKLTPWIVIPGLIGWGLYRYYSYSQPPKFKPYSEFCRQAMEFARSELQKQPNIVPYKFGTDETAQPINPEIAKLEALYDARYRDLHNILINSSGSADPWADEVFLNKVDEAMRIAYSISCLTLEDLKNFQGKLKSAGIERSFVECLTCQDSYQYRTFYYCTILYHFARGKYQPEFVPEMESKTILSPSETISQAYAEKFYQQGREGKWRDLYNDFCDRVRMYVNEAELEKADSRYVKWSQKDERRGFFTGQPSTLPT